MFEANLVNLPKILDKRGNLSFIEEFKNIPFKIARVYWIYDVPGAKIGIMLGISMVSSFLAGLMNGNMKDIVEKSAPFVNRINPASLIADAFYCINVYDDTARYYRSLATLAVMCVVLVMASFFMVRRERYDSI